MWSLTKEAIIADQNTTPALGEIAESFEKLKAVGVTRGSALYALDQVWWEDAPAAPPAPAQPQVLSIARTMAADPALDQIAARDLVATQLDALPDGTIVQVVEVRELRPGRIIRQPSYYQRSGGGWILLDPTDRYDGENLEPSGRVAAASIYYGAKGRENGFIRVLWVPSAEDLS